MAKIIDELQTPETRDKRLLILDEELPMKRGNFVRIGDSVYESLIAYDIERAMAIVCDPSTESLIGKTIVENID